MATIRIPLADHAGRVHSEIWLRNVAFPGIDPGRRVRVKVDLPGPGGEPVTVPVPLTVPPADDEAWHFADTVVWPVRVEATAKAAA